jgi:hypothetical protein
MVGMLRNLALSLFVLAAGSPAGTGTADALVLLAPGFAGQMRLGEAGWALGGGAWAACGNPSSMAGGFCASGGKWNLGTSTAAVAAVLEPAAGMLAGGYFRYAGRGGLTGRDQSGVETGEYSWSSGSAGLAGSFPLPFGTRGGISAGAVWEKADDSSASGMTASAGLCMSPGPDLDLGIAVLNMGSAPSWNGTTKNMPTEVSAGARWEALPCGSIIGGASFGFWTSSRYSAGAEFEAGGLSVSAGWTVVPGQDQAGGIFAGLCWRFRSGSEYSTEFAVRQTGDLSWPVSAGISVAF